MHKNNTDLAAVDLLLLGGGLCFAGPAAGTVWLQLLLLRR